MHIVIVGGVAGGASAATRLRRLSASAQITLYEKGEHISYANCGLPYYVGGVIGDQNRLLAATPASLQRRHGIGVFTRHEVTAVDPANKRITVQDLATGAAFERTYDALLLAPGATPVRPPLPGIDSSRVFTLRSLSDATHIRAFIEARKPRSAVIVGGGAIGLEMAEALTASRVAVTVVEKSDHVVAAMDYDMAALLHTHLRERGVDLRLGTGVTAFEESPGGIKTLLDDGSALSADMALLSIGVRPDTAFLRQSGLAMNPRGAIIVDEHMRTSDPHIYAVGDAVETISPLTGSGVTIALAAPANKQSRIAADSIMGLSARYSGTIGAAVLKLFDLTAATTGLNEAAAQQAGIAYGKVYTRAASHAAYYPGAQPLSLKLLFELPTGRLLGAQVIGAEGADKRIDVLTTTIRAGFTADDLAELELAYSPPYSAARDPLNLLGAVAQNVLSGQSRQFHWHDVPQLRASGAVLLDVRPPQDYAAGHIEGFASLPLAELAQRAGELLSGATVYLCAQSGPQGYSAALAFEARGFTAHSLSGGYEYYRAVIGK